MDILRIRFGSKGGSFVQLNNVQTPVYVHTHVVLRVSRYIYIQYIKPTSTIELKEACSFEHDLPTAGDLLNLDLLVQAPPCLKTVPFVHVMNDTHTQGAKRNNVIGRWP